MKLEIFIVSIPQLWNVFIVHLHRLPLEEKKNCEIQKLKEYKNDFSPFEWSKSVSYFRLSESFVFFLLLYFMATHAPLFHFLHPLFVPFLRVGSFSKTDAGWSVFSRFPLPFQFPPYFRSFSVNLREWCIRMMKSCEFPVSVSCESKPPSFRKSRKNFEKRLKRVNLCSGLVIDEVFFSTSLRIPERGKILRITRES